MATSLQIIFAVDEADPSKDEKTQQRIFVSHKSNDWFSVIRFVFRDPAAIYR